MIGSQGGVPASTDTLAGRCHGHGRIFRGLLVGYLIDYPTPANLNASWNWGSLAGLAFVWQLVSGIFLATHFGVEGVVGSQIPAAAGV